MARLAVSDAQPLSRSNEVATQVGLVIAASLFMAVCARITVPLPFTPVPLSLQNFAVLLVALVLGPWRGAAAVALYLAQGAAGLPVFTPGSAGLAGPTAGYLMAYPAVALVAGWVSHRSFGSLRARGFAMNALGALTGELVLFAAGIAWLMLVWTSQSATVAAMLGLYPFVFAEVMKIMVASALASRWGSRLR